MIRFLAGPESHCVTHRELSEIDYEEPKTLKIHVLRAAKPIRWMPRDTQDILAEVRLDILEYFS